jgi:hypothetical protein
LDGESYKPAAVAGLIFKVHALPQFSSGASCISATVAIFVHLMFAGGSRRIHVLWQACLFNVHVDACPAPFLWST